MKYTNSLSLQEIYHQLENWRRNKRSTKERIPESIWQATVELTCEYSIGHLSKKLGLSYTKLQARVKHHKQLSQPQPTPIHFIAVDVPVESMCPPMKESQCDRIQIERTDGLKMTLFARQGKGMDTQGLVETFLGVSHASNQCTK
jgi:hypothetical protein